MSLADKIIAKHGGQVEGQQTGLTGIADRIIAKNGGPETSNFTKSIANAGGSTLAGVGRGLKDIGVDGLGNAAIEKGRQIQADNQPSIQSFGDIAEHPIEYAKESIGQMAGQAGMALAGGGLGTAIGYGLGSLTGPLAPVAAPALGALGGYIGGNAPMLAQEYGSSREEQLQKGIDDKGRALTGALVNTGIENLGGFKPGGMAGIGKKAISELAGKSFSEGAKILGKKALVSGLEEASEEIPQQYVGAYGGGQDAPDLFNAENAKQAGLGAAMALPGGMLFGAGNTVAKHYRSDLGQENPLAGQWQQPGYEYRGEGIAGPQNQPLGLPAPAKGIGAPPQRGNIAPDTQIVFDDGSTTSAYDYFDQRMAAHGDEDRARQETFQALVGSPKPVTQPRLTDSGIIFSGYDGEQTVTPTGQPVPDEVKKAADAGGVMSNALLAGSQNLGFDFMGNAKTRPYKQRPGLAEAQAEREAIQNEGNLPPEDFSNNIPYDSGKGITWDDYEDNPLAGQWQSPQYKGKSRAQSIIDQQTKRPDLGLQGFIDSRNPQANLTENDLRQVGAWQQPQYDDKKAQKTGSTQTPEQNAQPLGGLQSQESSFQPTHTLNGTTPVVATDDPLVWFDGQNEIEISKDDVAEPINAIPTTRSNATPDTGAAGANRATGAADSGTGSGLSGGNGQSASGGTTGNARGLPGATQQPSDSQSGRALDPILTLSKGDYLQSQYKQFKADHPDASQLAANAYTNNIRDNYDALLEEAKANDQQPGAEGLGENASERQSKDSKKTDLQENQIPPTWENPTDEDDGRWHGTRIEKKPEFKKEQPTQGTVHRVYKGSSTGVIEFQPDGTDSIFRLRPDQIGKVLSISDNKQSANSTSELTGKNAGKSTGDIRQVAKAQKETIERENTERRKKPPTPDNKAEGLQGSKATRSQAAVGGEIGVNGYFYKGGQFLPSTDAEPGRWKIGKKWITSGKEQIEPSKWSNQPTPFSRAIFPMIQGWVIRDGDKLNFRDGVRQYNGEPVTLDMEIRPGVKGVMGKEALTIGEMIDAYNNGQRWFDVKPNAETVTTEQKTESHVTDNATQNETATPKLPGEDIFANAIKLAADSVEKLRKQDVYRVIDDLAAEGLQETVSSGAQNDNQAPQSESDKQALAKVAYDEMYGLPPYKSSTPSGQRQYEVNLAKYMADKFGMSSQEAKRRIKSAIDKDTRGTSSAVIPMLQSHIRTIVNGLYNDGFFNIAKPNITDNAAQNETATHGNVKQNEANGKENQSTDLSLIFAKLPKSGKLSAKLKAEVDAHPKADIIRTVQAHWADVLADHGYVTDKAGNPMDVSGNPLGKAKSILISNLKCAK